MAVFNSYVSLPEGIYIPATQHHFPEKKQKHPFILGIPQRSAMLDDWKLNSCCISIIIPIVLDSLLLTFHIIYHHPTSMLHLAMVTFRRPSKTPLSTRQLRGRAAVPINSTFQIPNARESHEMVSIYQLHQGMIAQPRLANQWLATGNSIHLNGERTICNKLYTWETDGDGDEEDYN